MLQVGLCGTLKVSRHRSNRFRRSSLQAYKFKSARRSIFSDFQEQKRCDFRIKIFFMSSKRVSVLMARAQRDHASLKGSCYDQPAPAIARLYPERCLAACRHWPPGLTGPQTIQARLGLCRIYKFGDCMSSLKTSLRHSRKPPP